MSTKFNVENPVIWWSAMAHTLRCYEMFLGLLEQAKPWDTQASMVCMASCAS